MTAEGDVLDARLRRIAGALDDLSVTRTAIGAPYVHAPDPVVRRRRRVSRPVVPVALFVLTVLVMGVLALSGHEPTRMAPAQDHDGDGTGDRERIVITAPGWTIDRYDEQPEGRTIHAETSFARADGARLRLHQRSHDYNDEFMAGGANTTVLGEPAVILDTEDHRTFWRHGIWDLETRSGGPVGLDIDDYMAVLGSLRVVDDDTWRAALPASVILVEALPALVDEILVGVPIPRGVDVDALRTSDLTNDRYQAAARTLRPIVCAWTRQWRTANGTGDTAAAAEALAALQSASTWPILDEMAQQGAWPQVLHDGVDALTVPRFAGDTPQAAAQRMLQGFGCG